MRCTGLILAVNRCRSGLVAILLFTLANVGFAWPSHSLFRDSIGGGRCRQQAQMELHDAKLVLLWQYKQLSENPTSTRAYT